MPIVKSSRSSSRTCPFCRSSMSELPDRVVVRFMPKADADPKRKLKPLDLLAESSLPRVRTVAHICGDCGFLALFEV